MHTPPPQKTTQDIASVLSDMDKQIASIQQGKDWVEGLRRGVTKLGSSVSYRNLTPLNPESRSADIALCLNSDITGVSSFAIVTSYSPKELQDMLSDPLATIEALQAVKTQQWLQLYSVRPLEVWTVPETRIWQGSIQETIIWLNKAVSSWLEHWFGRAIMASYLNPDEFRIQKIDTAKALLDQ